MYNFDDDFKFITAAAKPYLPEIDMVFMGGSQAIDDGNLKTAQSDYDLLVIGPSIEKPISLNIFNPETRRHFDVILRDRETLAYDIETARETGKGTLLHIVARSHILYDLSGRAPHLKQRMQALHHQGPHPVDGDSLRKHCHALSNNIRDLSYIENPAVQNIAALIIAYECGITALRAKRLWVGKGKILGRFLHDGTPAFKTALEDAHASSMIGDFSKLHAIAESLPRLVPRYHSTMPKVSFAPVSHADKTPKDSDEAFHNARMDKTCLFNYLNAPEDFIRAGAEHWLTSKHTLIAKAVDPERIGRPSNEYFYAVARYVRQIATMYTLAHGTNPQTTSVCAQAQLTILQAPILGQHINRALSGHPAALLSHGSKLLGRLVSTNVAIPPRSSPASHRRPATTFGLG